MACQRRAVSPPHFPLKDGIAGILPSGSRQDSVYGKAWAGRRFRSCAICWVLVAALSVGVAWRGFAQTQPEEGYRQVVIELEKRIDEIAIDPILLTPSDRVHGWATGEALQVFLWLHEATGKISHLREFIHHADRLLALRDVERGLPDHRGLYLPAWRTEDTYLGKQAVLLNDDGRPTLSFVTENVYLWRKENPEGRDVLRVERLDGERFNLELTAFYGILTADKTNVSMEATG